MKPPEMGVLYINNINKEKRMFDNNPFRAYKQMMKEQHRSDPDEGFPGRESDYDAAKEHEQFREEITARLNSHADSSALLAGLQSPELAKHVGDDPHHLHHVLDFVEEERSNADHNPGTPFSTTHGGLIDIVQSSPAYNAEHSKRIGNMEYAESNEPPPSGPGYLPHGYYPR